MFVGGVLQPSRRQHEGARHVDDDAMMSGRFEEALQTVSSVRDFSMVYDAYVQSEMHMMEILIQTVIVFSCYHTQGEEEESAMTQESETMMASSAPSEELQELTSTSESLSLRRARLEHLISSQPIMLNNVRLRQNPHDIRQWLYRVSLFTDPAKGAVSAPQPAKAVLAFTEAVKTVDPQKTAGKLSQLWIEFARFYERFNDLRNARRVFERAVETPFKSGEELAAVWSEWVEFHLRHREFPAALAVAQRATTPRGDGG